MAKEIAEEQQRLPARRRVGGERTALGAKRARGRERTAEKRFGWGALFRHAATNLEAFLGGIRLWKGVATEIAGSSRCLPAKSRVGGERTALGEKRARGRERTALGEKRRRGSAWEPFFEEAWAAWESASAGFFWGSESDVRHAATNLEAFLGWN